MTYPMVAHTLTARADGSPQPDKGTGANVVVEPMGADCYNQRLTGDKSATIAGSAKNPNGATCVIVPQLFENHSQDSRYRGPFDVCPVLPAQLGTGGNNQPFVVEPFCKSARARSADDATTWKPATIANTMNTFDMGEARANELVVEERPVYCLQGNGIDRADTAGCNGKGFREDASYTLNTIDRPAVVYALDRAAFNQGANAQYDPESTDSGVNSTIVARGPGAVCYGVGNGQANQGIAEERVGALNCMHDQQAVVVPTPPRYIVRRLTPTECARLQGFPDWWGDVEAVDRFEQRDYRFWLDVRKTYVAIQADAEIAAARAAIAEEMERATPRQAVLEQKQRAIELAEGRKAKDYTVKQMLTWYNKLHTDSAEYKMWGNGVSLPTILFVMQGIRDALDTPVEDDDWMN